MYSASWLTSPSVDKFYSFGIRFGIKILAKDGIRDMAGNIHRSSRNVSHT